MVAGFARIRTIWRETGQRPNSCESGYHLAKVLRFFNLHKFVGMYVNDWTLDFGPRGRRDSEIDRAGVRPGVRESFRPGKTRVVGAGMIRLRANLRVRPAEGVQYIARHGNRPRSVAGKTDGCPEFGRQR